MTFYVLLIVVFAGAQSTSPVALHSIPQRDLQTCQENAKHLRVELDDKAPRSKEYGYKVVLSCLETPQQATKEPSK